MKKALLVALLVLGAMFLGHAAQAANHKFPDCHGKNSVPCRPDPQPSHGKDCIKHGKGGINEDHCKGVVVPPTPTPTPSTTVSPLPSVSPTPSESPSVSPTTKESPKVQAFGPLAKTGARGDVLVVILGLAVLSLVVGAFLRRQH